MRIVLDTGAFFHPVALRKLKTTPVRGVVPAVVFAERCRQLQRDGRSIERFARDLDEMDFEVEPFGKAEGLRCAAKVVDDRLWARLSRDALVAGHVRDDDVLWTTNPRDFLALGLDPERIVDVSML